MKVTSAADVERIARRHGLTPARHITAVPDPKEHPIAEDAPAYPNPVRRITLVPASTVDAERVEWLMDCWLPRRSLTLLAGREGLGKSTIACDVAAQATRGELDNAAPMNVIYLQTEDSRSMTVRPRLEAAGADLDRVHFVDVTISDGDEEIEGSLDLPRDFDALETAIDDNRIGLVILDAAKSAMSSKIDGNSDEQVRRFLEPMSRIADRNDCAFLGLVHFGKRESADTGKLILGSAAWSQVARSVLSVARDEETGQLLVTNTKGNLAPRVRTVEAVIESAEIATKNGPAQVGRIKWGAESDRDARDLLRNADDHDEVGIRTDCEIWLSDFLGDQWSGALRQDVMKAAKKAGFTVEKTVQRAFKKIGGVSSYTTTMPRLAVWSLPSRDTPQDTDTPLTCEGVPTVPTGTDQGKWNVPTGGETQKGHRDTRGGSAVPSAFPPPEPAPFPVSTPDAIDCAILDSLTPDYPLSARTLIGSIPKKMRDGLDLTARLDELAARGVIAQTGGGYTLPRKD